MFGRNNRSQALEAVANAPVGAAVGVDGRQATILGTCVFDEAGDHWVEHLIGFGDGRRGWLAIENYDTTVATLWDTVDLHAVNGGPDDSSVHFDGVKFQRSESGTAQFTCKGDIDCAPQGTMRYVDFSAPDGTRLSFERFGEKGAGRRSIATSGTCPNCGAPLRADKFGRCESCGSAAKVDHGTWDEWETAWGRDVSDQTAPA